MLGSHSNPSSDIRQKTSFAVIYNLDETRKQNIIAAAPIFSFFFQFYTHIDVYVFIFCVY